MHALIACPAGRGAMHNQTIASVMMMQDELFRAGHSCDFMAMPFTEISDSRNFAATTLLDSGADVLIGIDDDVGVTEEAFGTMMSANVGYIGGCIPQRVIDLDRYADGIRKGFSNMDAQRYAAPLVNGPTSRPGVSKVDLVATAFFILRPEPLKRLIEAGGEKRRRAEAPWGEMDVYGFYDPIHYDEAIGAGFLEDYGFCLRLAEAGCAVHAYKGPGLNHSGEMTFYS